MLTCSLLQQHPQWYTPIRHNIMTTCLIFWRYPLCSQNSSDLPRHRLKTSESDLCCLAPGHFIVHPLGPVCWGLGPSWIRPAPAHLTDALSDWDLVEFGGQQHLGPITVFLELFLSSDCNESGHIVLLRGHCHWVVLLWWGGVLGPQQCLDGWCVSTGIHMSASTQGFPAEHRMVMRRSKLFTSPVSGFNIVADRCI